MKQQINSADEKMIIDVAKYLLNDKRIMGLLSKLNASPSDYVSGTWMKIKDIDFSSVNSPKAYIRRTMINLIYDDAAKEGILQPKKRPNRIPYASKIFIDDGFEDLDDDSAKSKQTKSDNMLSTTDDYAVDRTDTDRIIENAIGYYAPGDLYIKISKVLVRRKGFNSQLWLTAVLAELNGTGIGKAIADYASTHPLDSLSKISSIFYRNRNKVEEKGLTADERYDLLNDLKCSYPVQPGK